MNSERVIARHPPSDGREWDNQCARCGSSMYHEQCTEWDCQDGYVDDDEIDGDHFAGPAVCGMCDGRGGWWVCMSSAEFCKANPLPGRENINRGEIEWFTFSASPPAR